MNMSYWTNATFQINISGTMKPRTGWSNGLFGVHYESETADSEAYKKWVITHLASGLAASWLNSPMQAKQAVQRLMGIKVDWLWVDPFRGITPDLKAEIKAVSGRDKIDARRERKASAQCKRELRAKAKADRMDAAYAKRRKHAKADPR